jgi:diaminopimelate decarboxylase
MPLCPPIEWPPVPGFELRHGTWWCDDVRVSEIAREAGTPAYVYSGGLLRQRYAQFEAALAGVPHAVHYALKANSSLGLIRLLRSLGASADANSVGEIEIALRAGFIPDQIVFTGVGKSLEELERAVALGVRAINAESRGELERIDGIARAQGVRARVAIRVNPDVDAHTHEKISTGLKRNKFGVPIEDARALARDIRDAEGLELVGVHLHLGSQMTTLDPIRRGAAALTDLALDLLRDGVALEHLDLGGGLGVSYDGCPGPDVAAYGEILREAARATGLSLVAEPGRWLVAPVGALVSRVVDTKPAPEGRQFVILDAGMTELLRPALYGSIHRIVQVDQGGGDEVPCDIVGPVCESSDTFLGDRRLAEPKPRDLMLILDAGAYGAAMSSNYNRRPLPPEVLVDGDRWRLIRRRQSVDDMLALEEA